MSDSAYNPNFEGDDMQPSFDSQEADLLREIVLCAQVSPHCLTLVKADWGEQEVVTLVRVDDRDENGRDVVTPLAILFSDELYEQVLPRQGARIDGPSGLFI